MNTHTTLAVPKYLQKRIKVRAAQEGKPIQVLVLEVLEAAFPAVAERSETEEAAA